MAVCAILQVCISKNDFAVYYLDWTKNPRYNTNTESSFEDNEDSKFLVTPKK